VLHYYSGDDSQVTSAYRTFPMPAVIRARVLLDIGSIMARVSLTRRNVMARDKFACQ
jgi:hypothetical protein